MRVVYDISALGLAHTNVSGRTGVFRVIERVAQELCATDGAEVAFSATYSLPALIGAGRYLAAQRETPSHPCRTVPLLAAWPYSLAERRLVGWCLDGITRREAGPARNPLQTAWLKLLYKPVRFSAILPRTLNHRAFAGETIFHSPYFPLPAAMKRLKNVQPFLTVHDLIPLLYPQFCVPSQTALTQAVVDSLDAASWVICISESTKRDLCARRGVNPAQVVVIPWAADPDLFYPCSDHAQIAAVRDKYGIPAAPYFLSLNMLEPRKNIAHSIQAFARLVQEQQIPDLNLVLAGANGWNSAAIYATARQYPALRDRIILTGYVAEADLAALYSGALAFVYPSLYEGFGLPPLEAMQCGVPVITSNTSSLPEVVGAGGLMVDPTDGDALCQALWRLYSDPACRGTLVAAGLARARQFSWERTTAQTFAAYQTALAQ